MLSALLHYGLALATTLAVESLVVLVVARTRPDRATVLRTACALNLCSHPLATLAAWHGAAFPAVELVVTVAEAIGYRLVARQSLARAALVAGAANLASAAVATLAGGLAA